MPKDQVPVTRSFSLRVMGKDLNPDVVTDRLGISPTYGHRRGDANVSSSGRLLGERSEGIWIFEFDVDPLKTIDDNLRMVTRLLDGKQEMLSSFNREGFRTDVMIGVFDIEGPIGFSISSDTALALGSLGLKIEFDIYPA